MSDLLQPGQHPDADHLNAFIEDALPLHERQHTLAHLAMCPHCREIVYLSQSASLSESLEPQTIVTRKAWFSGWNMWPVAAVLAGAFIFTIYLHNTRIKNNKNTVATTAELQRTAPPLPAALPVPPSVQRPVQPMPGLTQPPSKRPTVSAPVITSSASSGADGGSINGASQPQSIDVLPLRDRSATFLLHPGTAPSTASTHGYRSAHDSRDGATNAANLAQQKSINTSLQSDQTGVSPESPFNPQYQAPATSPLMASTTSAAVGVNQTVEIAQATPRVDGTALIRPRAMKDTPTLPSRLPVLSIVSNVRRSLAIDTSGTLFFSKDGTSWQPIESQWTGRAVKVRLASFSLSSQQPSAKEADSHNASPGRVMSMRGATLSTHPFVFELTTDAGGVWTSIDGQTWKQK